MKKSLILLISIFHITIYSSTVQRLSEEQLDSKVNETPLASPDYAAFNASNHSFGLSSDSPKTESAIRDLQHELAIVKAALTSYALLDHRQNAQRIMSQEKRDRRSLTTTFENMQRACVQRQERTNWCNIEHLFHKEKRELLNYLRNLYAQRKAALEIYNNHFIDGTALCPYTGEHFDTHTMRTVHPKPTSLPDIVFVKK